MDDTFPAPEAATAEQMSLTELTEAADVSVRTVRYYIAEGLLPPPAGAGPGSIYGLGHLHRLRLIQRLKAAYLPLKEIRRRLAGLDDNDVRVLLEEGAPAMAEDAFLPDASLADARQYLSLLEPEARYRTEPMTLPIPADAAVDQSRRLSKDLSFDLGPVPARSRGPLAAGVFPARPAPPRADDERSAESAGLWHRIALGDEAELVISERVYARYRDRVDWLVRWARKVFG